MTTRPIIRAVRPSRRCRAALLLDEVETTRLARVDPRTGREIPMPEGGPGSVSPVCDPDATIIGALSPSSGASRPVTAEVVPPRDARLTSDVTLAWDERDRAAPRGMMSLVQGFNRRAVIATVIVACSALVAAALLAGRGAPAAVEMPGEAAPRQSPPPPGEEDEQRQQGAATDEVEPLASVDAGSIASQAVEALADGRLEEALRGYRILASGQPENRAWSLAVEIIESSGGKR